MTYTIYDARTGELEDSQDYTITEVGDDIYSVTFQSGFTLNLHKDMQFLMHNNTRVNGDVMGHRATPFTVEQLIDIHEGKYIEKCHPLKEYNGMTIDERYEVLQEARRQAGHGKGSYIRCYETNASDVVDSQESLEAILNSLGYTTRYTKAMKENEHGRFIEGTQCDVLMWDANVPRVITSVKPSNKKGWKIESNSGESKEVVIAGITLVPIYV